MCDDKNGSCAGHEAVGGMGSCGGHGGCCHGWGHKSLLRVVLAALVLSFVFCAGVKFGEMKALYGGWGYERGGYGYPVMMNGGLNYGYGMMRGLTETVPPSQATTTSKK